MGRELVKDLNFIKDFKALNEIGFKLTMNSLFSKREIRALVLLLPILAVAVLIVVWAALGRGEAVDNTAEQTAVEVESAANTSALRPFDPNTVSYEELRQMGVDRFVARNLVKRRATAGNYAIPEDVAVVYGIDDSLYAVLKPFIRIAPEYRPKPYAESPKQSGRTPTLHPFDPNTLDAEGFYALGIFTARQAEAMVRHREQTGGFRSKLEFRDCFLVGDSLFRLLEPYLVWSPQPEPTLQKVELNTADSTELTTVRGIGPATAAAIVDYRAQLGGFCSVEQLKELKVMNERNYEMILEQISIDSCRIQKIDINFATPKELGSHPYLTPARIRKILKQRQLKGGWHRIEEMVEQNILTPTEATHIAPYLQFKPFE